MHNHFENSETLSLEKFKEMDYLAVEITKTLPKAQLERAILFGTKEDYVNEPDIWVDAYLGFSQRLPLSAIFLNRIKTANNSSVFRISLDIPIGISKELVEPMFMAHQVLTLAAPKDILNILPPETDIRIADLGIPKKIYEHYKIPMPLFFYRGVNLGT